MFGEMAQFFAMMAAAKGTGKGKSKSGGINDFTPEKKVWVGGLSEGTTYKQVQDHFTTVAKPAWCEVFKNKSGVITAGVAYKTEEDAATALAGLAGSELNGATLELDKWERKPKPEGDAKDGEKKRKWSGDGHEDMWWQMQKMMKGSWGKGGGKGGGSWGAKSSYKLDESGGVVGEFTGSIKSFSDKNNYGFIECSALKQEYGKDVFVHADQKKGYQVGHKVKFTAFLTKDGHPQAKDLKSGLS